MSVDLISSSESSSDCEVTEVLSAQGTHVGAPWSLQPVAATGASSKPPGVPQSLANKMPATCSITDAVHAVSGAAVAAAAASSLPSLETIQKYMVSDEPGQTTAPHAFIIEEARVFKEEMAAGGNSRMKVQLACSTTEVEGGPGACAQPPGSGAAGPRSVRGLLRARREALRAPQAVPGARGRAARPADAVVAQPPLPAALEGAGVRRAAAGEIQAAAAADAAGGRGHCRSLVWNLRRNAELLERVNSGLLSAQQLLRFSHEELAAQELQQKRRRVRSEAQKGVVVEDHSTFAVVCDGCGSPEARGFMVHLSAGPLDNHRDSWTQMAMRGTCDRCGHIWVDGREV